MFELLDSNKKTYDTRKLARKVFQMYILTDRQT